MSNTNILQPYGAFPAPDTSTDMHMDQRGYPAYTPVLVQRILAEAHAHYESQVRPLGGLARPAGGAWQSLASFGRAQYMTAEQQHAAAQLETALLNAGAPAVVNAEPIIDAANIAPAAETPMHAVPEPDPPCWYIDHGLYGQITLRQDEADSALASGARVTAYVAHRHAAAIQAEQRALDDHMALISSYGEECEKGKVAGMLLREIEASARRLMGRIDE